MFGRFVDRVTSAVSGGSSALDEKIQQLVAMGFDATQARNALRTTDGNVERAAELLLNNAQPASNVAVDLTGDDTELQNVMQESLQSEENRLFRQAQEASMDVKHPNRSAAGNRAAEAAARRAAESSRKYGSTSTKRLPAQKQPAQKLPAVKQTPKNDNVSLKVTKTVGVSHHHPDVKVPAKFQDKTKEEQVVRCADRLKPYPNAVDTLYRALTAVKNDPNNAKYRKIDKTTAGYKKSLENVPGAEALLLAMNFHSRGAYSLVLERPFVDQALLYLGISALDGAKQSPEYIEAKKRIDFAKEIKDIQMSSNVSEAEALRRAELMAKCPSEPTGGRGALMQVVIADETVRRKFDGDDVLRDVLNWIGGHGSVIPEKILSREWCLVDRNRYPIAPIDCELNLDKTLQFIGCWPSGRLELLPSPEEWKSEGNKQGQILMGSSRGLGSAPTEAMH